MKVTVKLVTRRELNDRGPDSHSRRGHAWIPQDSERKEGKASVWPLCRMRIAPETCWTSRAWFDIGHTEEMTISTAIISNPSYMHLQMGKDSENLERASSCTDMEHPSPFFRGKQ